LNEEDVVVIGGHSVDDQEIKVGYAVLGTVHPDRVITNAGSQPGDVLVLTKPLGTGAINTAIKHGKASESTANAAIAAMTTSAARASRAMIDAEANACTDVTGFGLIGHAYEMAHASNVMLNIDSKEVPLLPDVLELIADGMLTRGDRNNREYVGETVKISEDVTAIMQSALFDPQTAGGLLVSLPEANVKGFLAAVHEAWIIGSVSPRSERLIEVK